MRFCIVMKPLILFFMTWHNLHIYIYNLPSEKHNLQYEPSNENLSPTFQKLTILAFDIHSLLMQITKTHFQT